jgi:hypothetical protein
MSKKQPLLPSDGSMVKGLVSAGFVTKLHEECGLSHWHVAINLR